MKLGADGLRQLSQLLDACAALPAAQQQAWIDALDGEVAALRPALRRMLARQASGQLEGFLEQPAGIAAAEPAAAASDFAADDRIGPYRLLRPIGRGGMGEVWLATRSDGQLKRTVALKLPVRSVRRSVLVQRFERERDILGGLIHPHIARLYDAGVADDGQPYMALEYVEGTPITEAADARGLDVRARVHLLRQVVDAVQYAHANLVIHRDLKPGNVLVNADGEARLLDFGIAKLMEDEAGVSEDSDLTRVGGRALTLRYAAPEMIQGGVVTTSVDVWALGVLLYELLAGRRPFDGDGPGSIEQAVLAREPVPPSRCGSGAITRLPRGLAGELDSVVRQALQKDVAARYASVGAFADDLDRWLRGEPVRAQRNSGWYRTRKFVARNRLAVAAAALAGMALVGAASVAVVLGLQARAESARAVAARNFMVEIFRQADPDASRGREVSAKQLLLHGYQTVLDTMEAQPLLQAELLGEIGRALESMFDLPATDAAYAQAALRYERAGRPREAAALTLDRAALRLASTWDVPAADGLLQRAEALHPVPERDDEFLARSATYRIVAAEITGDAQGRLRWYAQAQVHADAGLRDASPRTVLALRMLALTELAMNQPLRATARLSGLLERLQSGGTALPSDRLSVLVELGVAERSAGRYRASLARHDAAAALCQTALDPRGSQCVYNEFHRSSLLLLLGLEQQALSAVPLLAAPGEPVASDWQTRRFAQAYEVLSGNGRLAEHPDVVAQVVAAGQTEHAASAVWQGQVAALAAQTRDLLRRGEPAQALAVSERAQALVAQRGLARERFVQPTLALHAMALHLRGAHAEALALLDQVHAGQVEAVGAQHPSTQLASLLRVRPLWALQRRAEALALVDRALPVLRDAMGPQAPTLARIQALRDELAAAPEGSRPDLRKVEVVL